MYKYKIYFDDSGIPNRMFEEKPLEEQMYIFMEILATDFDVPLDDSIADIFSIAEDIITHFLLLDYEKTLNLVKACEVKLLMFLSEFLYDIIEACPKQELITVFEDRKNEISSKDLQEYTRYIKYANDFINSRRGKWLIKKMNKKNK